jgi:hypothetical protein
MNHPQQYERGRAYDTGARMATHEYCPPATGNALQISAKEYATAILQIETPTQLQIMTGGPPELMPTTRDPARAVQLGHVSKGSYQGMEVLGKRLTMSRR